MSRFSRSVVALLSVCSSLALADTDMPAATYICPIDRNSMPVATTPAEKPDPTAPTHVSGQRISSVRDGVTEIEGEARLRRDKDTIGAQRLRYDGATREVNADGAVEFGAGGGERFWTESLQLNLDTHSGRAESGRYRLRDDLARGTAETVEFLDSERTRLTDVRFTTCREGQDDWFLRMGQLDLDTGKDVGTARDATVEFMGLPIFYFPYFDFPISDRRKSGFLYPRFGHSDNSGTEISVPYYLNLAPNYDATLAPRLLSRRGVQLETEFRYKLRNGDGTLDLDTLPHDRLTGDSRYAGSFVHRHRINRFWSADADINAVSDNDYLQDFGDSLTLTSKTHLPRTANLSYRGPSWAFSTRLSEYQTVDASIPESAHPYRRLPQLRFARTALPQSNELHLGLGGEWTTFVHDDTNATQGGRLNLGADLSYPLANAWGYVTPRLGLRAIGYRLENAPDPTEPDPDVALAIATLDAGLVLERETRWGERAITQTLEPRLYYLYAPRANQDAQPVFDTAEPDLRFDALFRDNRFVGGDRLGDANRLALAITSRFIDQGDGIERLRLSLGRSFEFTEATVELPGAPATTDDPPLVAEALAWLPGNWHLRDTVEWNLDQARTERNGFYLQYQPQAQAIFSLGHVYARDDTRQLDTALEWPLGAHWSARARSLRSLREERNIDSHIGLEYRACCWALRLAASRRWRDSSQEQVNAVWFEFELGGLASVGGLPTSPLDQGFFYSRRGSETP